MVAFLIMSAKFATLGLLEINKNYGVTIFVHGVTNEILSHGSNYTVVMVMWPKFGNSGICMREVIITSIS